MHGHLAEVTLHAVRLHAAHHGSRRECRTMVPVRVRLLLQVPHAQVLDLALHLLGHALVDVRRVDGAVGRIQAVGAGRQRHAVGHDGRTRTRLERHEVEDVVHALVHELAVAVRVHEVERELAVAAGRDEEVLLGKRPRAHVGVPLPVGAVGGRLAGILRSVAALRPRQLTRDLRETLREVRAGVGVHDADHAGKPVVVGRAGEHHPRAAGNRAHVLQHVRPHALVAPEGVGLRAVGVDGPERLRAPERLVRVLPARVRDPSVVQHGRQVVRLVVRGNEVEVVFAERAAHEGVGVRGRHAAHVGVAARGGEDVMPSVGEVDRVEVVEDAARQLAAIRAVGVHLVEVERLLVVRLEAEEDARAVVRDVRPPERSGKRRVRREARHARVRPQSVQHEQLPARYAHVAEPMARLVLPLAALGIGRVEHQQTLHGAHERISEHHLALHAPHGKVRGHLLLRRPCLCHRRPKTGGDGRCIRLEPANQRLGPRQLVRRVEPPIRLTQPVGLDGDLRLGARELTRRGRDGRMVRRHPLAHRALRRRRPICRRRSDKLFARGRLQPLREQLRPERVERRIAYAFRRRDARALLRRERTELAHRVPTRSQTRAQPRLVKRRAVRRTLLRECSQHFARRRRARFDRERSDLARKEFAHTARRPDESRHAARNDGTSARQRHGHPLRPVEPHAHHAFVQRRHGEMPRAVRRLRRVDRPVAFHVARTVQAERQDLPVLLEGEEHASGSGLDAEDLVVTVESGRLHPCGDRKRVKRFRQRIRRHLRTAMLRIERPARGRRQPPQRIRLPDPFSRHAAQGNG